MKKALNHLFAKFHHSKKALAIPMTFLILFVSTLGMISATYYFAVERVNSQSQNLKVVNAKKDFLALDQGIMAVVNQPGSAREVEISDSGGKINVEPLISSTTLIITDNRDTNQTIFNQTTGQIRYELPYSDSPDTGLYLKGDNRAVVNQTGSCVSQLYIASGAEHAEIRLQYRPLVFHTTAGIENNRCINNMRIYVINMNTSDTISLYGKVPIRISCESTQIISKTIMLDYSINALTVTSILGDTSGQVTVPISSTSEGAVINLEIIQCNIKLQRSML